MKWGGAAGDPGKQMLLDGDQPGDRTLEFAKGQFAATYSISLEWADLGARVVRYESLVEDPVGTLGALAEGIAPIDERRTILAAFLSRPEQLFTTGLDRRHVRTGASGRWATELRGDIVQAMAAMSPYREACERYDYDWDRRTRDRPSFDYTSIDPFKGAPRLDNGVSIGPWMSRIYLLALENARERWPDPVVTAGDSFWNWLISADAGAGAGGKTARGLPNLVLSLHGLRPDLQAAFPDPRGADRDALLRWFFDYGIDEHRIPPEAAATVRGRYR
jgi:hypothetical protein